VLYQERTGRISFLVRLVYFGKTWLSIVITIKPMHINDFVTSQAAYLDGFYVGTPSTSIRIEMGHSFGSIMLVIIT